jgi:hypothetical protein
VTEPARCAIVLAPDGLAHRTEAVLDRERGRIPAYVERLREGTSKGEPDDDPEPPTVDELVAAIEARDSATLGVAAFLAGRCRVDGDAAARIDAALRDLVGTAPVDDLGLLAEGYVEAALAIGLRGDVVTARAALQPLVHGAGDGTHDWLAAAALAQLGDPSGWPTLLRDLHDGIEHVRLMAARQLLLFVPYDGEEVDGGTIDVGAALRGLADDPSEWIREEAPALALEAGCPA